MVRQERSRLICPLCYKVFSNVKSLLAHGWTVHEERSLRGLLEIKDGQKAHQKQKARLNRIDTKVAFSDEPGKARIVNSTQVMEPATPPSDVTWGTRRKQRP